MHVRMWGAACRCLTDLARQNWGRRCNVPIPAMLGWRSRASNDVALTFRHWSRSSDSVQRSRSESSRGRAQPCSTFIRATQLPRALRLIYVSRVCRYSVNRTPHSFRFRFTCPDPPACVPTVPDHSGHRAHTPSTLTRADHRAPWPNAVYTTAFVALFQLEPTVRGSLVARYTPVHS